MKAFLLYAWRMGLWALRSLWRKYPKPRQRETLYSRSYLRHVWLSSFQDLDRMFNSKRDERLLWQRRVMVAKRRLQRLPE